MMKRQTLNCAVSHIINPTGVGNRRGECTGFEKGSFGGPGVGKLSVSITVPEKPSSFLVG